MSDTEYLASLALEKPTRGRRHIDKARLTVWHPSGPLRGYWNAEGYVQWAAQFYEYRQGVPATIEYRGSR